ncbi:MAG TPA: DNA replication/repair protein RecF [Alphaproteobacteria bacterium]|nr:DNA replication/repair protein RecF [Alphaproteobacteria bacterium]
MRAGAGRTQIHDYQHDDQGETVLTGALGLATASRPLGDEAEVVKAGAVGTPARALSVDRLTLTDFRSYTHLRLDCGPASVVLNGANGVGKTNILEAISFLAPGRGLRGARLAAPSRHDGGDGDGNGDGNGDGRPWAVAARINTPDGYRDLGSGLGASADGNRQKRLVRIDGEAVSSQAALAEVFSVQWLTPAMDRLFLDGATARRRFLDRLIIGHDAAHAGRVLAYGHALRERSRLLRGQAPADGAWLDALEDTMAAKGVAVAAARIDLVGRLNAVTARPPGPFPGAGLMIGGELENWLISGPALDAEDRLRDALKASREPDAVNGGAARGPHRSDLIVRHLTKGRPAAECSTGEQKALLIAIILAAARMQMETRGAAPGLLLDEVTAHLDAGRREALFDEIAALGAQAWMTGTEATLFEGLRGRARFFTIDGGRAWES